MAIGNESEKKPVFTGNKIAVSEESDKPRRVEPLAMLCVSYIKDKIVETPLKMERVSTLDELVERMATAEANLRYRKAAIGFPVNC